MARRRYRPAKRRRHRSCVHRARGFGGHVVRAGRRVAGGSPNRGDSVLSTKAEQYPFQSSRALDADTDAAMGSDEDSTLTCDD